MKIKVLTFNVGLLRLLFGGYKVFEFVPFLEDRFEIMLENIKALQFDIISFQELYNSHQAKKSIEILTSIYPYHAWEPQKNTKLSSGLLIFSKYPLKNTSFEHFKINTFEENIFVNKGFLCTEVDLDVAVLDLMNVHTTAGGYFRYPDHPKVNRIRNAQIHQILQTTYAKDKQHFSLITGDLNTGPQVSKENFHVFQKENFVDIFDYKDEGLYTWDNSNSVNQKSIHAICPSQRIDHILYKPKANKKIQHHNANIIFKDPIVPVGLQKKNRITISDHYAVTTELEIY